MRIKIRPQIIILIIYTIIKKIILKYAESYSYPNGQTKN